MKWERWNVSEKAKLILLLSHKWHFIAQHRWDTEVKRDNLVIMLFLLKKSNHQYNDVISIKWNWLYAQRLEWWIGESSLSCRHYTDLEHSILSFINTIWYPAQARELTLYPYFFDMIIFIIIHIIWYRNILIINKPTASTYVTHFQGH